MAASTLQKYLIFVKNKYKPIQGKFKKY